MLPLVLASILAIAIAQTHDGDINSTPPSLAARRKAFDLPRAAPTARIIRLSTEIGGAGRGRHHKRKNHLLHDKAGSFDNFDAFDFSEENREDESAEKHKEERVRDGEGRDSEREEKQERRDRERESAEKQTEEEPESQKRRLTTEKQRNSEEGLGDFFPEE